MGLTTAAASKRLGTDELSSVKTFFPAWAQPRVQALGLQSLAILMECFPSLFVFEHCLCSVGAPGRVACFLFFGCEGFSRLWEIFSYMKTYFAWNRSVHRPLDLV
jgi:hypothetical protein